MTPRQTGVLAVFFGPAACAFDQLTSYAVTNPASPSKLTLGLLTAVAASVAGAGLALSWGVLRRRTDTFEVDRFVAIVGIGMNAFFLFVVLVGFGLPKLLLQATD